MGSSSSVSDDSYSYRLNPIGPGFWNVRGGFTAYKILNIGTHMSVVKLENGKYIFIDTIPLDALLKTELDSLTNDGKDIEGIIATHPFHSLSFPDFYAAYPNAPFYGTPRHCRYMTQIPWAGDISKKEVQEKWEGQLQFRHPAGAEFDFPKPEAFNHFSSMWVFHPGARVIHVDDTLNFYPNPSLQLKVVGIKKGKLSWHPSIEGPGLYSTAEAPTQFIAWVEAILSEWDFDNICCAHSSNLIGGGRIALMDCLNDSRPMLLKMAKKNSKQKEKKVKPTQEESYETCSKYNVSGNECG